MRASSSSVRTGEEKQLKASSSQARRLTDQGSQKRLERASQVQRTERGGTVGGGASGGGSGDPQMRREVAHLRRRDVDLAGQLRARDAQVEQLTATLRELQLVTQRQIGLYKRQLHLKDNSLQALQEELMLDRGQQAPMSPSASAGNVPTVTSVVIPAIAVDGGLGASAGNQRSSRRQMAQVPSGGSLTTSASVPAGSSGGFLAHSNSERRTSKESTTSRSGHTPRPVENERGRGGQAMSPGGVPKKDTRERSLGAQPHSPRPKPRDVATTVPSRSEAAPARRRGMPAPATGRSTSAEERDGRGSGRRRRGEAEVSNTASQKVLRTAALRERERGQPQTARQRR